LRADLKAEEYLVDPTKGSVSRVDWSPNRIDLRADLREPARVRVNQNWHPGWRATVGDTVSDNGLIAVDLPAGRHDLTLRFLPRSALAGLFASLIALIGLIWIVRFPRQPGQPRPWLPPLLSVAPFGVVALVVLVVHEPPVALPPPLTPTGEAMVVDELPDESTPLNVRFEPGVTLVGWRLQPEKLSERQELTVELDWRVDAGVPNGAGVSVQVVSDSGELFVLDHTRLSSAMELAAAPKGPILRDVLVVRLSPGVQKGRWTVWVGVWNAFGDRKRLPASSADDAYVDADMRVRLSSFVVQ
jgi:hypothetical protein